MSLFTSEPGAQSIPLYDTRKTFETSESEPLPTDASTETSSNSEDEAANDQSQAKGASISSEKKKDALDTCKEETENSLHSVKSYEECKECNGKVVNDALSQENIQLLRGIKSKEKKLKETRRQLNEERAFYEQQKMDLWKTITKKKSKSQIVQTDDSNLEITSAVKDLETQIADLKKQLEKEANKSNKLKAKCQNLRKKNGRLKSEISLNEEDYEKSWKEIQEKLDQYKKECGSVEKNSGIIKNVYDQVLKKNAYLARSNFALQAELRRLYRKFEHFDKPPSIKKLSSKSTVQSASSPDLWRRHREESVPVSKMKKMRRSKTAPSRSKADESSDNLVVSGSLISVHVEGEQKRLRPVFLVLDDKKKKKGSKVPVFGCSQDCDDTESDSLPLTNATRNESDQIVICNNNDHHTDATDKETKKSKNACETITQESPPLNQESPQRKKENLKDKPKKKANLAQQNEQPDKNETQTYQTKLINTQTNHKRKIKETTENIEKENVKNNEQTTDEMTNNESTEIHNDKELVTNQFETNEEDKTAKTAESSMLPEDSSETIQNIMKHRTDSICSDSEKCIIKCETHSSSIQ